MIQSFTSELGVKEGSPNVESKTPETKFGMESQGR